MNSKTVQTAWLAMGMALVTSLSADYSHARGRAQSCADFVNPHRKPWDPIDAYSDKTHPFYLGNKPYDLIRGNLSVSRPQIPEKLKTLAEREMPKIIEALNDIHRFSRNQIRAEIEFEIWPIRGDVDSSQVLWAFARWRFKGSSKWTWFDQAPMKATARRISNEILFPKKLSLSGAKAQASMFNDFWNQPGLYDKPLFSNAVFVDGHNQIIAAWMPPEERESFLQGRFRPDFAAYVIPQPSWFQESPKTFTISAQNNKIKWPDEIEWVDTQATDPHHPISKMPKNFKKIYQHEVEVLSEQFLEKNSATPNQLLDVAGYLKQRHLKMGLPESQIELEISDWNGNPQPILTIKLPGSDPSKAHQPVIVTAHMDTAFDENHFHRTEKQKDPRKRRRAVHGADDNISGVAAGLITAQALKDTVHEHPIWIVYLPGEEFPADCLGARKVAADYLKKGIDPEAIIVVDMIGFNQSKEKIFQVNPGSSPQSYRLAQLAVQASMQVAPDLSPKIRSYADLLSYLFNTDGIIFNDMGFRSVILINEDMNQTNNDRDGYHTEADIPANMHWDYAFQITRVIVETAAKAAKVH